MKDKQKAGTIPLLNFFVIYGLDINSTINIHDNLTPKVLSSFSNQGNNKEHSILLETFANDYFLGDYIFPSKVNCLFNLDFITLDLSETDENAVKESSYQTNYIKYVYEEPFFHCFSFQYSDSDVFFHWYFNCLIFWEKVKTDDSHCYAAKAMVIITKEPFFCLCKDILFSIHSRSKDLTPTPQFPFPPIPLEPFIIQLFSQMKSETSNMLSIDINGQIKYKTAMESFISICDLNYSLFFELFSISDVLFLIEQFLQRKTIIIASTSIEFLYPVYHILLTLIHPLDVLDNTFCYRLFTANYLQILTSLLPCFVFIHLGKMLDEEFFKQLTKQKGTDLTVVCITPSKSNMMSNKAFIVKKQYYQLKANGAIEVWKFNTTSIIEKVVAQVLNEEMHYLSLIELELKFILSEDCNKNSSSFFSSTGKSYDDLRRLFFGLMTKFLVIMVPRVVVDYQNEKITFSADNEDTNNSHLSAFLKDHLIKEFYDNFTSSPSFDIIYKNNQQINNPNLKNLILLDELLKITSIDKTRLYHDFHSSSSHRGAELTEIKVDAFKCYKANKLFYMNKYNRLLMRGESKPTFHLTTNALGAKCFIYDRLVLYFEEFRDVHTQAVQSETKTKAIERTDILLYEVECFYNLLMTDTIPLSDCKEYSAGLAGLMLSFLILNDEAMKIHFKLLFELFHITKGFYQKFNVNLSMIYEILISHKELYDEYIDAFLADLNAFHLIPTSNIYLKYNNNVQSKIRPLPGQYIPIHGVKAKAVKVSKCEVHGDLNQLNKDFYCKECKQPLYLSLSYNKEKERDVIFYHPKIMLEDLLRKMIIEQSVVANKEFFNEKFYDDIGKIAFLMKGFFDMNLFN